MSRDLQITVVTVTVIICVILFNKYFDESVLYFFGVYITNRTLHGRLEIQNFPSCRAHSWNIFRHSNRNVVSSRSHVISSIKLSRKYVSSFSADFAIYNVSLAYSIHGVSVFWWHNLGGFLSVLSPIVGLTVVNYCPHSWIFYQRANAN